MLKIRFNRVGKRNRAHYRITVQEHTIAPGGRHVEVVGSYNPHSKEVVLKEDRIKHWISKGAQLSDSVHNLFVTKGLVSGKKRPIKMERKRKEESVSTVAEEVVENPESVKKTEGSTKE